MTTVNDIVTRFEKFAPKWLAEKDDPIGLQLGDLQQEVHRMMVTLDVRPETVQEAIDQKVDFIFAHHPAMFHAVHSFDLSVPQNQMYAELLKHGITVYAAHTNLDSAQGGMNDWLADKLGLQDTMPLLGPLAEKIYKLAVFVPVENAAQLRVGLAAAGAGQIGEYSGCSFSVQGTGRFTPGQAATPAIGSVGQAESVPEEKVEVVFPARLKSQILAAMRANHPYEEIVFDLYAIEDSGPQYGMGRVGNLEHPITVADLAAKCKQIFEINGLRLVSPDPQQVVSRVAVLGGSGAKFYPQAQAAGAEVYITGDVSYHTAHDMLAGGLNVLDPGHHFEWVCQPQLKALFSQWATKNNWPIQVISTTINTDPFRFI